MQRGRRRKRRSSRKEEREEKGQGLSVENMKNIRQDKRRNK